MSASDLATRLGVSQQNVAELERSEVRATIRLDTLRRAAEALDCDLVYAIVPRTSLEEAVRAQARRRAMRLVRPVAHHGRLEDQEVATVDLEAQLVELATQFEDRRGLWTVPEPHE